MLTAQRFMHDADPEEALGDGPDRYAIDGDRLRDAAASDAGPR